MKAPQQPEPLRIIVTDLIDNGLIKAPTTVFGTHSGKRIEALLTEDGRFLHRDIEYSSPSVAAGRVITATLENLRGHQTICLKLHVKPPGAGVSCHAPVFPHQGEKL